MKALSIFLLLFCGFTPLIAQTHFCCTSSSDQEQGLERLKRNRQNILARNRDELVYIPIKFHLIANDAGQGRLTYEEVMVLLCQLNAYFEPAEMQFYIDFPFNLIDNSILYDDPVSDTGQSLIPDHLVDDAINVFIGRGLLLPPYGSFYAVEADYIFVSNDASDGEAPAHEMGHFFSLAHTFRGWDFEDIITTTNYQVPPDVPSEFQPAELMDQSNCLETADLLCDTPPDYYFAASPLQDDCEEWSGNTFDPNGDVVDPMENNLMSFFSNCTEYVFTEDQNTAMRLDYDSPERAYLQTGYTPAEQIVAMPPNLLLPVNEATNLPPESVTLSWEALPGVDYYLLEIDEFSIFLDPISYVVNGTSIVVTDLAAEQEYHWRVLPLPEYQTCDLDYSPSQEFTMGLATGINPIEAALAFTVQPNPLLTGQGLQFRLIAPSAQVLTARLYSSTGEVLAIWKDLRLLPGPQIIEWPVALNSGMYFLQLANQDGHYTQKLVVQD